MLTKGYDNIWRPRTHIVLAASQTPYERETEAMQEQTHISERGLQKCVLSFGVMFGIFQKKARALNS